MIEHLVLRNLPAKIDKKLYNRHGFKKGLSCETCATINDTLGSADCGKSVHGALLNFVKALDKVPHALIMETLSITQNFDEYLLGWIHNLFYNRTQYVILDGQKSAALPVTSSLPQGSVLRPVLFLALINDLQQSVDRSVLLFVDNTLLHQEVTGTQIFFRKTSTHLHMDNQARV